jgi:hypothetical protein
MTKQELLDRVTELETDLEEMGERCEALESTIACISKDLNEAVHRIKYRGHCLTKEEQLEYFEQALKDIDNN